MTRCNGQTCTEAVPAALPGPLVAPPPAGDAVDAEGDGVGEGHGGQGGGQAAVQPATGRVTITSLSLVIHCYWLLSPIGRQLILNSKGVWVEYA